MFVLQQFEVLKVRKAIPILHEYQEIKAFEHYASSALAAMGEKEDQIETLEELGETEIRYLLYFRLPHLPNVASQYFRHLHFRRNV